MDLVGLIPAAGEATRLGAIPCSKEILPVAFRRSDRGPVPRAACHFLLESFHAAGVERAYVVLRSGKWDIPAYLEGGGDSGVSLAYLPVRASASVPETLARAHPFVAGSQVALGFPDVVFQPPDAYTYLLRHHESRRADVTLGLFPAAACHTTDMVGLGADGRVERVEVRPRESELELCWLIAAWSPAFSRFLHEKVRASSKAARAEEGELQLGEVFRAALEAGLEVVGVPIPGGSYRDLGTPEAYARALTEPGWLAEGSDPLR